jgi:hypothetical protein
MPAPTIAAIPATTKKAGREDIQAIFQIVIFGFDER